MECLDQLLARVQDMLVRGKRHGRSMSFGLNCLGYYYGRSRCLSSEESSRWACKAQPEMASCIYARRGAVSPSTATRGQTNQDLYPFLKN